MPKQKIRLPRTWGEESMASGRHREMKWGGYGKGLGPGLQSQEATYEEEEVEDEEEVLDKAEAAIVG